MKVIISGDRNWRDPHPIVDVLDLYVLKYENVTFIHGDARGADTICDIMCRFRGYDFKAYPADWNTYKKAAGPIRNKYMLSLLEEDDEIVGFHPDIRLSKGTRDMLTQGFKAGLPVFWYNGEKLIPFTLDLIK